MPFENTTPFHFLSEISKENSYRLLFPDPKAGMAIIWLYEKLENGHFPNKLFKEADIHDALKHVNATVGSQTNYHLKEQYNTIISELQEYFLRYDEEHQQYSFKEYAYTFCKHAKDTLKAFFDPTQIEKICFNLREKLSSVTTEAKLIDWFSLDFATFKSQLKNQLDYLDKQIDQSVADLRENRKLNLHEGVIIETLRQIDDRFEVIRNQNKELRIAFREIDAIRKLLESYSAVYENDEIDKSVYDAITFFQDMRHILSLIDKRLDRIQPRIKQLFSNLNKPLFNARVEKFLGYLINYSGDILIDGKKEFQLPGEIPSVLLHSQISNFTIVERKADLFPAKPRKRIVINETPGLKIKAFANTFKQVIQQDDVTKWMNIIQKDVADNNEADLSAYFFTIFNEQKDENSLGLAISVIYRAMKFFEQQKQYVVIINTNILRTQPGLKTTLWEMLIKQK
jgi:hypothetical protein